MRIRNTGFILLGVAVLVFKSHYTGPFDVLVHSYTGNIAVSFAIYFLALRVPLGQKYRPLIASAFALAAVEIFEVLDGFGIMSNTYDPLDLVANVVGVMAGLALDTLLASRQRRATKLSGRE